MSLNTDIFYHHISATIIRVWLYYQHPTKTNPCRNPATTSQTTPIIFAINFQYHSTPTTSHIATNPSNIQYHCTTDISLIHITLFTYASYNHAQIYAPTASCYKVSDDACQWNGHDVVISISGIFFKERFVCCMTHEEKLSLQWPCISDFAALHGSVVRSKYANSVSQFLLYL